MTSLPRSFVLAGILVSCAVLPLSSASADTQTGFGVTTGIETVTVTAEKRSSTVQKTPLSITAISGQQLQETGITSAQAITSEVPGMSIATAGPGNAVYEIRGLTAPGGESSTIGFYLDETPITPPVGAALGKVAIDPDLYDLSRVEVLRGPQGTLYGAGSMGGTIKLVTNPPDTSGFYGSGETIISGTDGGGLNYGQNAMVNVPIDDTTAFRLVGSYMHTSGWINRIVVPNFPLPTNGGMTRGAVLAAPNQQVIRDVNDENLYSARGSLLFNPVENFKATPMIFYQDIKQGGMNAYDSSPGTLAHYEPFDISEPSRDKFVVASLPMTYDFENFSLTSATSFWDRWSKQAQDGSEQLQGAIGLPGFTVADGGLGPVPVYETDYTRQMSEELRATSSGSGPWQWLLGGFYSDYHYATNVGISSVPPGAIAIFGAPSLFNTLGKIAIMQWAAFGNTSYQITPDLKLEAGLRYFHYDDSFNLTFIGALFGAAPPNPPLVSSSRGSNSGVNPMFNISYTPTPDLMVYARAAKGFREGAGNFPIPTSGPPGSVGDACRLDLQQLGLTSAPNQYKPDSVWNYEVGEKGRLFDNRLTVDADVYYIVWSQVQSLVSLTAPDPCNLFFTANGANASVKGGEFEMKAQITDELELTQNVGYAYAAYTNSYAPSNIVDGQRLFDVPNWTVSTLLRYEHPLGRFRFVALADNSFTSGAEELTYAVEKVPARDLTNIRLGLTGDNWTAFLFVNNVFNQRVALEYLNLIAVTGPPYNRIATNQPLTAGIDLSYNF